jgi:hypothetical protein
MNQDTANEKERLAQVKLDLGKEIQTNTKLLTGNFKDI